jgi:cytoplasmic iron level regulating protein YaaA (DUF328/UPF0246 family)
MLLRLNTTKTMDLNAPVLPDMVTADPDFLKTAQKLAGEVSKMTPRKLADLMSLSDKLAEKPKDLMGFSAMGWKAADNPPDKGTWLFTRPLE